MTTEHLCHWCHRVVAEEYLIWVPETYIDSKGPVESFREQKDRPIVENPWHAFCFAIVNGSGE